MVKKGLPFPQLQPVTQNRVAEHFLAGPGKRALSRRLIRERKRILRSPSKPLPVNNFLAMKTTCLFPLFACALIAAPAEDEWRAMGLFGLHSGAARLVSRPGEVGAAATNRLMAPALARASLAQQADWLSSLQTNRTATNRAPKGPVGTAPIKLSPDESRAFLAYRQLDYEIEALIDRVCAANAGRKEVERKMAARQAAGEPPGNLPARWQEIVAGLIKDRAEFERLQARMTRCAASIPDDALFAYQRGRGGWWYWPGKP